MSAERNFEHFARVTDPAWRLVGGLLRRMVVQFTSRGIWELKGFEKLKERVRAEVFQGVGFWARPPEGATVEAVVLSINGSDHPVVVQLRDEATRKAVADALLADEAVLYNSQVRVYAKADGTLEARSHNGTAYELARKSDVQEIVDKYNGHAHADPVSGYVGTPVTAPAGTPRLAASPTGTTVLKGE